MDNTSELPDNRYPQLHSLIDDLEQKASHTLLQEWGENEAVDWSYGHLGRQTGQLAKALCGTVSQGDRVALFAPVSAGWLVSALAIIRAGAVLIPVDLQAEGETLAHILKDSGAGWIFTDSDRREAVERTQADLNILTLQEADGAFYCAELNGSETNDAELNGAEELNGPQRGALPTPDPDDTAVLFYTSGTTGPPKGVPLSQANLGYQLKVIAATELVTRADRVLLPLPMHHVYPFVVGMLTPLHLGLTLIVPHALTGKHLIKAVREGHASLIIGVPRLYQALYDGIDNRIQRGGKLVTAVFHLALALGGLSARHRLVPSSHWLLAPVRRQLGSELRMLVSGGAPLSPELASRLRALGWQVAEGYGLTETSPLVTINPPEGRLGSVGCAVPGTDIRLRREGMEEKVEDDRQGEVQVRGPGVFEGYHNLEDKTREAFDGDWYRTGDVAYRDDAGFFYVTGRLSTLLVTEGGENIQPDILEERYARHPKIEEIGILQHDGELVGLVVPAEPGQDGEEDIRRAIAEAGKALPSYQRLNDFRINRSRLPRTHLGKIQRHLLKEAYKDSGKMDGGNRAGDGRARAPLSRDEMHTDDRSLLDNTAAEKVWRYLAQRYPDAGLTPDSDLQLGLKIDSLEWVNLSLEIGERTGVDLNEEVIQELERVRDLLREVARCEEESGTGTATDFAALLDDPQQSLSDEQRRWLAPRKTWQLVLARLVYGINWAVMRTLFRTRLQPSARSAEEWPEQLPKERFILAANHASYLDAFALAATLPFASLRRIYWSGLSTLVFNGRLRRLFCRALQIIPIDPREKPRSSLALAAAVLSNDNGLMWFPEGRRSFSGELGRFRPGLGILLAKYPAVVVPAAILGSHQAWPPDRRLPRLHPLEIRIGEPVDSRQLCREGEGDTDAEKITQALQARVEQLLS